MSKSSLQNEALCRRDVLGTHAAASSVLPQEVLRTSWGSRRTAPIAAAIGAPCVLASHAPSPPRRRSVILQ